jgi:hypothetical protein
LVSFFWSFQDWTALNVEVSANLAVDNFRRVSAVLIAPLELR